ncbi:MAG: FeoB-associated Cys-rich membrane protein [Eubacterium sp.]|nr:FeoB-associated Cys-rich membrane protein [Eubacterium sp.]
MVNIIATLVIVGIVGGACYYIYKEKKKGTHCIGCPMAGNCSKTKAASECASGAGHSAKK